MDFYNSTHNFYRLKDGFDINKSIIDIIKSDYSNGIMEQEFINEINPKKVKETFDMYNENTEIESLKVVKNEEFGFFICFNVDKNSHVNIGDVIDIPWWGLKDIYRVEIETDLDDIYINLVEYVEDDSEIYVADRIINSKSNTYQKGDVPIFVSGKIPADSKSNSLEIKFNIYKSEGYEVEELIDSRTFDIEILDFVYDENVDESFFLDLWQHPCSWARAYGIEYFSDEHFVIIEKYLKNMKKLGQKVIDLIVSDYPWAGQKCFAIDKNPSRLYEYNMIRVSRTKGELELDFSILEKYIDLCFNVGIDKEINIFGILGNWHGYDFGSPIPEYNDPIRVRVYDNDKKVYDYIRTTEELKKYIFGVFNFLNEKNVIEITKIIGDEPGSPEKFSEYKNFLNSCAGKELTYKYAVHSGNFIEKYEGDVDSFSLNTILLADIFENRLINNNLTDNFDKLTWYSCCFPENSIHL